MTEPLLSIRPHGGFDVILADPPWKFASNSAARPGRNALRHYDCMTVVEIAALPVRQIAAKSALLLMWTTSPFAAGAHSVIAAWGFRYVSQVVWIKDRIGTGYWARNRHETLMIAKRGGFPCPKGGLFKDSVITEPRREHSRKPDFAHDAVERFLPIELQRIELFSRTNRPGWTHWGDQTGKLGEVAA